MINILKCQPTIDIERYYNLNIHDVYQDITDKDNLLSLLFLAYYSENKFEVNLIGFRQYNSNSRGYADPNGHTFKHPHTYRISPNGEMEMPADNRNINGENSFGNHIF